MFSKLMFCGFRITLRLGITYFNYVLRILSRHMFPYFGQTTVQNPIPEFF